MSNQNKSSFLARVIIDGVIIFSACMIMWMWFRHAFISKEIPVDQARQLGQAYNRQNPQLKNINQQDHQENTNWVTYYESSQDKLDKLQADIKAKRETIFKENMKEAERLIKQTEVAESSLKEWQEIATQNIDTLNKLGAKQSEIDRTIERTSDILESLPKTNSQDKLEDGVQEDIDVISRKLNQLKNIKIDLEKIRQLQKETQQTITVTQQYKQNIERGIQLKSQLPESKAESIITAKVLLTRVLSDLEAFEHDLTAAYQVIQGKIDALDITSDELRDMYAHFEKRYAAINQQKGIALEMAVEAKSVIKSIK